MTEQVVEPTQVAEVQTKKKSGKLTAVIIIGIIFALIFCCCTVYLATVISDGPQSNRQRGDTGTSTQEHIEDEVDVEVQPSYEIGQVLEGPSFEDIKQEYRKQKDLSDYKAQVYLESLSGTKITWVGYVSNVDDYIIGDGNYIALAVSEEFFNVDLAFIDVVKEEDLNLDKGTVIKVSGTIDRVDEDILGLSPYIKDTTIEIIGEKQEE